MSKIYGELHVTNTDWRYVYNTIVNFFNLEIQVAYIEALKFFNNHKDLPIDDFLRNLNTHFELSEITEFRKNLIKNSIIKSASKIKKPKKNTFTPYNNRSTYIHTPDVKVDLNKKDRVVRIETTTFDNFDKYMANNSFISEFVNMVTTINWPTRTGPKKTTRGCTLIRTDAFEKEVIFLSTGPNPPEYSSPSEVIQPPAFTESQAMKTIKLTSTLLEETAQPLPPQQDLTGM
jgi:hypothetical protein